jgi:predicted dehydrogenase
VNWNIAVVGCGLIGNKRASALGPDVKITHCFDLDEKKSKEFSIKFDCISVKKFDEILDNLNISIILIATPHSYLSEFTLSALDAEKHVFVEKPGALESQELEKILHKVKLSSKKVQIGYNHRFHPAIRKAFELVQKNTIGEIMFLRGRYGHGGRLGYEKEWRASKSISGGGELIDQGSHLLDLCIAFLGEIEIEYAATPTYFWDMSVEDNVFISVKNKTGAIGFIHASCTEWKNMFSLEIYGRKGKIDISGLGGSYGEEKLTLYNMKPSMGIPDMQNWDFPSRDDSWNLEFLDFIEKIRSNSTETENLKSSIKVLKLIEDIYKRTNR